MNKAFDWHIDVPHCFFDVTEDSAQLVMKGSLEQMVCERERYCIAGGMHSGPARSAILLLPQGVPASLPHTLSEGVSSIARLSQ